MIKTSGIQQEGQPYLTKVEDQNGKSMVINSSRMQSEYLSPSQLLQAGLAGCMSMTIKGALFRNGITYRDVRVIVDMTAEEGKTCFTYRVEVDSEEEEGRYQAIVEEAAKNCYVRGLLENEITISKME